MSLPFSQASTGSISFGRITECVHINENACKAMFHIVIEPIKRQMSELLPSEDDNDYTEVFRESLDTECVEFSVGNPRVEHITGIVHLYKRNSTPYGSAAVAQAASTTPQSSAQVRACLAGSQRRQ